MFNFLNKKEDPIISFVCTKPGLITNKEVLPIQANRLPPSWWKGLPAKPVAEDGGVGFTAKICPSFTDYFSQGFIIPAWQDSTISYDVEQDYWHADVRADESPWDIHGHFQFLDHVDFKYNNLDPTIIFKLHTPWKIITKPGWSVMQVPLFYHFDNDFVALPGIIDTDIIHDINIQMFYFGDKKKVNIKRGQPLVQYIPFKRQEISHVIRQVTDDDEKRFDALHNWIFGKFAGTGTYRHMQRLRDRNHDLFDYSGE